MVFVYILQSETSGRFYIGVAACPQDRVIEHNRGQTQSTRNRGPSQLVWMEAHPDKRSATRRERELKSWKSHTKLQALIEANGASR